MRFFIGFLIGAAIMFGIVSYFYNACADPPDGIIKSRLIVHSTPKGSGLQGCDTYEVKEVKLDRNNR